MASIRYSRRAIVLGLLVAVAGFSSHLGSAAVPPSVAVRQQSPDIEAIIAQLEAKAINAVGTWTTKSGRQDVPAQEWTTGIGAGGTTAQWYWKSEAKAPASTTGLMLFDDSENAYLLPYGSNTSGENAKGGERFQYDTLRTWQTADYLSGHYLLHMNLLPRQFIAALGGLSVVGTEADGETQLVHLRSDPGKDTLAMTDPALDSHFRGLHDVMFDIYYDPQKRSISKVVATLQKSARIEISVSSWDHFRTSELWPKAIVAQSYAVSMTQNSSKVPTADNDGDGKPSRTDEPVIGKPVLTQVESFSQNADGFLAIAAKRVQEESLFITEKSDLRSFSFYSSSLLLGDSASDHAALAEVCFLANNANKGLNEWRKLEAISASPESHKLANNALAPWASVCLTNASLRPNQQTACVELISFIMNLGDDKIFATASPGILSAWKSLRKLPATQSTVATLTPRILQKLVKALDPYVIQSLITLAEQSPADDAIFDPLLKQIIARPIATPAFSGTAQERIIIAAVQAGAYLRAQQYLQALKWDPNSTPDSQRLDLWAAALRAAVPSKDSNNFDINAAIITFNDLSGLPPTSDELECIQALLLSVGDRIVSRCIAKSDATSLSELILQSAQLEGADRYWQQVLFHKALSLVTTPSILETYLAPGFHAYQVAFGKADFETNTWLQLSKSGAIYDQLIGLEIEYANKALATSPNDSWRSRVIFEIGNIYSRVRQYSKGAQAIESASTLVENGPQREQLLAAAKVMSSQSALTINSQP